MTTTTFPDVDVTVLPAANADDLCHTFCDCTPAVGLCGTRLHGIDGVRPPGVYPDDCLVCDDLDDLPCPRCGN